jgi:hypothetical protein
VKLFADGSIGARTAALREPYADQPGCGRLLHADDELHAIFARCRQAGLRVAVHAIGDAAIDQTLRQLERLAAGSERPEPEWLSLEHAELLTGDLLERAAALGVRLSLQPNFIARWGQPGGLYEQALGHARWLEMNPLRRIFDADIAVSFGSDGMPMDPALGLLGASGHPLETQRLGVDEALDTYHGLRVAPWRHWDAEEYWRLGCDGFVLYEADPQRLAGGEIARAPVRGIFRHREWLQPPTESLFRWGLMHVD